MGLMPPRAVPNRSRQSGAVAVLVALSMTALMGFVALGVDAGRIVHAQRALQASTDSAALAGGRDLVNGAAAADTTAKLYGAGSGSYNPIMGLQATTVTTPRCLTSLTGLGVSCVGSPAYNALEVTQTITIPSTFAGIFNKGSWTLSASSLASRAGGPNVKPVNMVLVLDTSSATNIVPSTNVDPNCVGRKPIVCALENIQILLNQLKPSAANVGLLVFPPVDPTTIPRSFDCLSGTSLSVLPYGDSTSVYTLVGSASALVNDFKTSNTATTLSTTSNLSKAIGAGVAGCAPLSSPGSGGSFYADAITAAQNLLSTQPNKAVADSVIVLLSYGSTGSVNPSFIVRSWGSGQTFEPGDQVAAGGAFYKYVASSPSVATVDNEPGKGTNAAVYWSSLGTSITATKAYNQCAGAVAAATAAKAAGTRIVAVGYAAATTFGGANCAYDSTAITPCQTLRSIASDPNSFFSTSTTSTCAPTGVTPLRQIFDSVAQNLMQPRLLPPDAQ